MSPYRLLLSQQEYTPLTDDMSELMNRDWRHYPQVKYFTAVILAGSILLNTKKSQAVMINMVELYGRTKIVDGHREPLWVISWMESIQRHFLPIQIICLSV